MKLRFTRTAITDLHNIRDNPAQWQFREDLFPRCQIAYEGRHTILFCMDDSALLVVRILHSSMDLNINISDDFN